MVTGGPCEAPTNPWLGRGENGHHQDRAPAQMHHRLRVAASHAGVENTSREPQGSEAPRTRGVDAAPRLTTWWRDLRPVRAEGRPLVLDVTAA